jgi:putative N6-adenine-specific DNA methylase
VNTYFAVSAPGVTPFTMAELHELLPDASPVSEPGGVSFQGGTTELYRANLHLRTSTRILARLGNFFRAETFEELEERSARLPWERFLHPGQPVSMRVTCHKSRLYHSDAVARTLMSGMAKRVGRSSPLEPSNEENTDNPAQLIVARISEDICTISIDSSGLPLYKRGYRQAVAKAPLRETLAAALILASGWDRVSPLLDPFCGSGTIPIEAALLAGGIPPGIHRRFTFMDWPDFDENLWRSVYDTPIEKSTQIPQIQGSDRDAGAVKMAQANAGRAGVAKYVKFSHTAVSGIEPSNQPGWVVTNPPYGLRVSPGHDLRDLYAQFSNTLRKKCPGWHICVLCSDPVLLGQMGMEMDTSFRLVNGGVSVRAGRGIVPGK